MNESVKVLKGLIVLKLLKVFLVPSFCLTFRYFFFWSQSQAFLVLSFWGSQSRSFFGSPFLGEPEPELFSFCLFGGAGARAGKAREARLELEPSFSFFV